MLESSSVQLRKDVCLNLMCDLTLKRLKERKNALHLSRICKLWWCNGIARSKSSPKNMILTSLTQQRKYLTGSDRAKKIPPSNYHLLALRKFTIWFDTRLHISHSGFTAICTLSSLLSWQKNGFCSFVFFIKQSKIFGVKIQILIAANNDLAHHLLIFAHEYHQVVVKMNGGTTLHLLTHAKVRGLVE